MLMHLAPLSSLALVIPGEDWLYQFTQGLTNLTTANGGALTSIGMTFLAFIAFMMLAQMAFRFGISGMHFSLEPRPLEAGEIVVFLARLAFCCLLENYWVNPLPGIGWGFNHLFSQVAQAIVQVLDQNSLANFNQLLAQAGSGLTNPSMFQVSQQICYWLVQILLGLAGGIIFLINASSFIFYAITALFGPLFIPLYMTNSFRGKFFQFIEVLLSFAMLRAVASAFIFVWESFMNTFLQKTFNGDYSIGMWIANFVPVLIVFASFIINMLFIPAITQAIFGGGASAAGSGVALIGKIAGARAVAGAARAGAAAGVAE